MLFQARKYYSRDNQLFFCRLLDHEIRDKSQPSWQAQAGVCLGLPGPDAGH